MNGSTAEVTTIKSDADWVQQLVAEISSQRPHIQARPPELKTTEGLRRRYYYSERTGSAEVVADSSKNPTHYRKVKVKRAGSLLLDAGLSRIMPSF